MSPKILHYLPTIPIPCKNFLPPSRYSPIRHPSSQLNGDHSGDSITRGDLINAKSDSSAAAEIFEWLNGNCWNVLLCAPQKLLISDFQSARSGEGSRSAVAHVGRALRRRRRKIGGIRGTTNEFDSFKPPEDRRCVFVLRGNWSCPARCLTEVFWEQRPGQGIRIYVRSSV